MTSLHQLLSIVIIISVNFTCSDRIHKLGTDEYEITTIRPIAHRVASTHDTSYPSRYVFNALGKSYHLHMTETNCITSGYAGYGIPVRIIDDKRTKDIMVDFAKEGVRFFQDENNNGAFVVKYINDSNDHGGFALDGIMSYTDHDIIIEPLVNLNTVKRGASGDIQHVIYRRRRSLGNNNLDDARTKRDGVGYKYNTLNAESFSGSFDPGSLTGGQKSAFYSLPHLSSFIRPQTMVGQIYKQLSQSVSYRSQTKPTKGFVSASVEMLAWSDLSFWRSFEKILGKKDVEFDILKYIATVVNAANLRFKRGIRDPSLNVSVVLTGAVICKTYNCSTFTERHNIRNTVNNYVALDEFAETLEHAYMESRFIFKYDYAAAFTRLDITDTHGTPIGVSFTDKICSISDGKSSSIIEDQGGYSSIGTLVHELSHTLGSDHDGWFRGRQCRAADGYIMSALSPLTKNGFYFSQCSINSMKKNLMKSNASCVHDVPHTNHLYTSLVTDLPGQIYNRTEQCHQIYGTHFCLSIGTTLEDICYKMYCWDPILPNVCSTKSPAALGTSCGPKKWCIGGECVYSTKAP